MLHSAANLKPGSAASPHVGEMWASLFTGHEQALYTADTALVPVLNNGSGGVAESGYLLTFILTCHLTQELWSTDSNVERLA